MIIDPGVLTAGRSFSIAIALREDITKPFDYYLFVETSAGTYTIDCDGSVRKGIVPIVRNASRLDAPYFTMIRSSVKIPASMQGETVTFYAMVVDAGKIPPVQKPSDLTPDTPYVIMLDKKTAVVI